MTEEGEQKELVKGNVITEGTPARNERNEAGRSE